jgi:hypothetical protein
VRVDLALIFCAVTGFTRLCPPSSTRFPWINHRSRSLSPPCMDAHFSLPEHATRHPDQNGPGPTSAHMKIPPWALAVAEMRPRGLTGRVGAGLSRGRASPEMRPGYHGDWATTPQAAPQSLGMTPDCSHEVARCCQKGSKAAVRHARPRFGPAGAASVQYPWPDQPAGAASAQLP